MCLVHEIAILGVAANGLVKPIVGYADVQIAQRISQCQVKLLGVGRVYESVTAPGGQRQALVGYTECGLNGSTTQILATPDVTTYNVSTNRCLYCVLCKGGHAHGHTHCE